MKIIKNKKEFNDQAATEIRMLRYIKANDSEKKENIIRFHECFTFRHHFVFL